jgi:hypothetical protein
MAQLDPWVAMHSFCRRVNRFVPLCPPMEAFALRSDRRTCSSSTNLNVPTGANVEDRAALVPPLRSSCRPVPSRVLKSRWLNHLHSCASAIWITPTAMCNSLAVLSHSHFPAYSDACAASSFLASCNLGIRLPSQRGCTSSANLRYCAAAVGAAVGLRDGHAVVS